VAGLQRVAILRLRRLGRRIEMARATLISGGRHMNIEEEILSRIRAAKAWDREAKLEDFQLKAAENGFVLINLRTRRAQLIYDEDSELSDLDQLFPKQ
jgi:hypothetical protein